MVFLAAAVAFCGGLAVAYGMNTREAEGITPGRFSLPLERTSVFSSGVLSSRATTGSAPMTFYKSFGEWTCNGTFGGSQTLQLEIDTGSADLWVMSTLQSSIQLSGHAYYDSSKSSTFEAMRGYTWKVGHSGGASGSVIGTETVNIGGASVSTVIELANNVSTSLANDIGQDGFVGLGRKSNGLNTVHTSGGTYSPQKTFFENIQGSLENPIFALYLNHGASSGSIDFGYIDDTKYSGSLVDATLVDSVYWEVNSTHSKVGSTVYANTIGTTAIIDSGTTLIKVFNDTAAHLYGAIDGAQYTSNYGWIFPCTSSIPSFQMLVGDYYAIVGAGQIKWRTVGNGNCRGGVQLQSLSEDYMIFGSMILATQYMVFDPTNTRVQFGLLK